MLWRHICYICGGNAARWLSGLGLNVGKDPGFLKFRHIDHVSKRHWHFSPSGPSDGEVADKNYQSHKTLRREVPQKNWQTAFERETKDETFPTGAGDEVVTQRAFNKSGIYQDPIEKEHHPQLCSNLSKGHFFVCYNHLTKTPCWVYEYLTPDGLSKSAGNRKKSKFRADDEISGPRYRACLEDYRGSGYDRGHMAAAGNHRSSQEAMNKTFLLSNILPQVGESFNQGIWRQLEEGIRDIALLSTCVHLYTGPLYIPRRDRYGEQYVNYRVIGGNRVAVPTHLFKTMLIGRMEKKPHYRYYMLTFIMPNARVCDSAQIHEFIVRNKDLHVLSGMKFFSYLENNALNYKEIFAEDDDNGGFIDIFRERRRQIPRWYRKHNQDEL